MKSQKIENCIYTAKEKGCFNPGRVTSIAASLPSNVCVYRILHMDVDGGAYKKITPFTSSAVHSSLNLIIV